MPNLDSELIEEKGIDVESFLQNDQAEGLVAQLHSLLASQSRNLQNLSALVVFNFLAAGLFFVTQVKIANVIGKEKFGLLAYGIALGMYGQTVVNYGMNRTLVRDLIHWPKRFAELVMASLLLRGVLLGLVVTGLLIWKLLWQPADMSWAIIVVVVAYSVKSLDLQPAYDAWHCMARHAVYNMIRRGLYFALIWGIILTNPQRLTLVWIGFALLVMEVFYLFLQQRWAGRRIEWSWDKVGWISGVRALLKNNSWIWLAAMVGLSFGTLNQIILKHYCGPGELGSYAASWQIVAVAMLLLTQVSRVGNPATARVTRPENNACRRKSFLLKYSCVMAAAALPVVIPSVLFPGWIMKTVFKPEYASSAAILRVLGIYLMVFSLGCVASQYIVSARMEKTYFASVIVGGILSITLCLVLIPRLAGLGTALALLIAHGISMGFYWMTMIQHVRKQR
jgi:O-antigen/teichoic acid export membrane protein